MKGLVSLDWLGILYLGWSHLDHSIPLYDDRWSWKCRGGPKLWHAGAVAPVQFEKGPWWAISYTALAPPSKPIPPYSRRSKIKNLIPKSAKPLHRKGNTTFLGLVKRGFSSFFWVFWVFLQLLRDSLVLNFFLVHDIFLPIVDESFLFFVLGSPKNLETWVCYKI